MNMRDIAKKKKITDPDYEASLASNEGIEESVGPLELAVGAGFLAREGVANGLRQMVMNAAKNKAGTEAKDALGRVLVTDGANKPSSVADFAKMTQADKALGTGPVKVIVDGKTISGDKFATGNAVTKFSYLRDLLKKGN